MLLAPLCQPTIETVEAISVIIGRSLHRFTVLCAIPLLAVSSLPQLVCCCDVCWGPGGLFGNPRLCQGSGTIERAPKCSCCEPSGAQQGEPSGAEECSAERCNCSFSLLRPPPINGPSGVETLTLASLTAPLSVFEAAPPSQSLAHQSVDRSAYSLTPGQRCALYQTWRS
jgi:hypothetical protein